MFRKLITLACLIGQAIVSHAQNGQLPPVNLTGQNICDHGTQKLVLYDEFNGTTLGASWITFNSWKGMAGGDHDDWGEARCVTPYNAIYKDNNIVVSNGTVKLQVRKEATSWQCATCVMAPRNTDYSTATIATPYTKGFNTGRFEAKIKMPTFKHAHSTFWLWWGGNLNPADSNSKGVNEIDVAEAYGDTYNNFLWLNGGFSRVNYSVHAWEPGTTPASNPYNMVHDEVMNRYPNQSWWDVLWGRNFKINDFHTYTCDWDTGFVQFFVDGSLVSEQWKYYQRKSYKKLWNPFTTYYYNVGSHCSPTPGEWQVMRGFPYNNQSYSNLRFTTAVDDADNQHSNGLLGEMEIDYVKVWQKRIDAGWTNLCTPVPAVISGPNIVCSTGTFTSNQNGFWHKPYINLSQVSSNSSSITVQTNANSPLYSNGYVSFYTVNPACPNVFTSNSMKVFDVGPPTASRILCTESHSTATNRVRYHLSALPTSIDPAIPTVYNSPHTFAWRIEYGPNFSLVHNATGQFVSTPPSNYTPGTTTTVRWTVVITNACGSVTKSGTMDFFLLRKAPSAHTDRNPLHSYFVASIPDDMDYEGAVSKRLAKTFIDARADDVTISSTIEKIEAEELEPYILFDSTDLRMMEDATRKASPSQAFVSKTVLYPNPTSGTLNIILSDDFALEGKVTIILYDLMGKQVKAIELPQRSSNVATIDIFDLPNAIYNISILQGSRAEHHRLIKTNK